MYRDYNPSTLFGNDMVVKLYPACDRKYTALETYSRSDGRHGRFLISGKIKDWLLDGCKDEFMDRDISHFLYGYDKGDGTIRLEVRWLNHYDDNHMTGVMQAFDLTKLECLRAFIQEQPVTKLCWDKREPCHVDASGAEEVLKEIQQNKRMKRAFSKAMREFQWRSGQTIYLGPDFPRRAGHDFFFRTSSGTVGGLILSEYDGRMKYNVHT